jgi:hypothetical protein
MLRKAGSAGRANDDGWTLLRERECGVRGFLDGSGGGFGNTAHRTLDDLGFRCGNGFDRGLGDRGGESVLHTLIGQLGQREDGGGGGFGGDFGGGLTIKTDLAEALRSRPTVSFANAVLTAAGASSGVAVIDAFKISIT